MIVSREDSFRGSRIHTFVRRAEAGWLGSEIEEVLDADFTEVPAGWIEGTDYVRLVGNDAFELYEALAKAHPAERPLPALVLYAPGLTLACMDRPRGAELRALLLGDALKGVQEAHGRDRLEREVRHLRREEEMSDRGRKAGALHRIVEASRRCGELEDDDAGYVACMASIAEVATGLRFPVRARAEEQIARELDVPESFVDAVLGAMDRAAALI